MAIKTAMRDKTNGSTAATGESSNTSNNAWMDWFEKNCAVDMLLCDENCTVSRELVSGALSALPSHQRKHQPDLHSVDYAAQHDEFLESLLFEQAQRAANNVNGGSSAAGEDSSSAISLIADEYSCSTGTFSSNSLNNMNETSPGKRRRASIRLHRRTRTPPGNHHHSRMRKHHRVTPLDVSTTSSSSSPPVDCREPENDPRKSQQADVDTSSSSAVSFMEQSKTDYPHPSHFLHPQCRMQKDKGRGEAVGANICAKGRDACLDKLRAKMQLLTQHAAAERRGAIKRRKPRVSEHYDNFIETRSLIELRMGFLSMTYGVLLRWDTGRTGKVTLVVLRKMCHESFYAKQAATPKHLSRSNSSADQQPAGVVDKNAIMTRPDGMEVALLDPPYRVPRPDVFAPAMLRLAVLDAAGMNRKSNWSIQLSYEGQMETVPLIFSAERSAFVPKQLQQAPLQRTLAPAEVPTMCELKLFEHRSRRRVHRVQRRLVSTIKVPLASLHPQPRSDPVPTRLRLSFGHDRETTVQLELLLESDYATWLKQELEARRRAEDVINWRRMMSSSSAAEQEEEDSPWEWICSVC